MKSRLSWIAAAVALGSFGCGESPTTTPDAAPDAAVDAAPDAMANPCEGKANLDACTLATGGAGVCHGGMCVVPACGDGVLDAGEICDDANTVDGDGCAANCLSNETCGNGVVDAVRNEECDNGVPGWSGAGCSASCASQAAVWTEMGISPRVFAAAAWDSARGRLVVFGGQNVAGGSTTTWEWDGTQWLPYVTTTAPAGRSAGAMAFDATRNQMIYFGGFGVDAMSNNAYFNETWAWNGSTWTKLAPATSPPGRSRHAMAFDPDRGRIVLFGGQSALSGLADTWEWDGTTWTERLPATVPPRRSWASMAYDGTRDRMILFGGSGNSEQTGLADTWAWDGTNWAQLSTSAAPTPRFAAAMVADSQQNRVILYGGYSGPAVDPVSRYSDAWTLGAAGWQQLPGGTTTPNPRWGHSAAWDASNNQLLVFGGNYFLINGESVQVDLWAYNGTWRSLYQVPDERVAAAMAYDPLRGRVVLFGGSHSALGSTNDTWEWNGKRWTQVLPASAPSARTSALLEFDQARGKLVLFGGNMGGMVLGDTWTYDGVNWTQLVPATAPTPLGRAASAYDSARGELVVFGGFNGSGNAQNQTWVWTGTDWQLRTPAVAPPAMTAAAMAYDPLRAQVLLFGGRVGNGTVPTDRTWAWDGTTWREISPTTKPSARAFHKLAFNAASGRVTLIGGQNAAGTQLLDAWDFDGTDWVPQLLPRLPPPRAQHALAYDALRNQLVLSGSFENDFWYLQFRGAIATETCTAATTDADTDGLAGCADPDCWGQCDPLCPPGTSCPATRARCGDAVCNAAIETSAMCPMDCP